MIENSTYEDLDLLEFPKCALDCAYISCLQTEQCNDRAKLILWKIDLRYFSLKSIRQAINYIFKFKIK
jgi:hypothetical protein